MVWMDPKSSRGSLSARGRLEGQNGRCEDGGRGGSDATADSEDGGRGHEPRNAGASRSWKRPGKECGPGASKGTSADDTLILPQEIHVRLPAPRTVT